MPHLKCTMFLMPEESVRLCGLGLCVEALNNSDILMLRDNVSINDVIEALGNPKFKRVNTTCVARVAELTEVMNTKPEVVPKPVIIAPKPKGRPKGSKNKKKKLDKRKR